MHRIAALVALGKKEVTVQISKSGLAGVVDSSHSDSWWPVANGYISENEAVDLFGRMFAAKQPIIFDKA